LDIFILFVSLRYQRMAEMEKISRGTCLLPRMVTGGLQKEGLSKAEITTIAAFIRSLLATLKNSTTR